MDQLITYGPAVSDFTVYDDFYYFKNNTNCRNIINKLNLGVKISVIKDFLK